MMLNEMNDILFSLGMISGVIWRIFIIVIGMYYVGMHDDTGLLVNILIGLSGIIWILKELMEDSYKLYEMAMEKEGDKK